MQSIIKVLPCAQTVCCLVHVGLNLTTDQWGKEIKVYFFLFFTYKETYDQIG